MKTFIVVTCFPTKITQMILPPSLPTSFHGFADVYVLFLFVADRDHGVASFPLWMYVPVSLSLSIPVLSTWRQKIMSSDDNETFLAPEMKEQNYKVKQDSPWTLIIRMRSHDRDRPWIATEILSVTEDILSIHREQLPCQHNLLNWSLVAGVIYLEGHIRVSI